MRILFYGLMAASIQMSCMTPAIAGDGRSSETKAARQMCVQQMRDEYGAEDFHGVSVLEKKPHVFQVSGSAERHKRSSEIFNCKVKNGSIKKLEFAGWHGGSDNDNAAAAAAIAAVIGAVVIGVAASNGDHEDHADYNYRDDYRDDDRPKHWSPHRNVTCYRNTHACYENGHGYSTYWTRREFD